ncbi:MAG: hypothetical protein R2728_15845 [Chitinophagales bacterium]
MAVNDKNGIIEIELDSAFAISINNNLFINISTRKRFGKENDKEKNFNSINYFSRVLFQGSVMLVSANESNFAKTFQGGTTSQRNINSNSGPTPYPSINTQLPKHQNPSLGNYSMPTKKQKGPMQQFMFFVEDGNVKILNVENVLELISNDDELLSKYESMKDAKNLLPYFVKKYNESHPLYFID